MDNLVIIQARCGSSRLPNKVLLDLCGKSVLQRVVERVKKARLIDEVIVATSIERENLPLIKLCAEMGIRVFVGSENDVLDRFYQPTRLLRPKNIVRITADCPMFDWRYLDQAISSFSEESDYLWFGEDAFPDGLDVEIMRYEVLERAWGEARLNSEREHVTLYIRNHPEEFGIQVFDFPIKGIGHYRWTLDEQADYEMIQKVYSHFIGTGNPGFITEDIVRFLNENKDVMEINTGIGRNEGLKKSVMED